MIGRKEAIRFAEKPYGMTRDEICEATGLAKGGSLKTWLEELEQCGFIRTSRSPGKRTKDAMFRLMDNYTLFYHRFIRFLAVAFRRSRHER